MPQPLSPTQKQFAETFADHLLIPENDWLRHFFTCDGFSRPINSHQDLAIAIIESRNWEFFVPVSLYEALKNRDKPALVKYLCQRIKKSSPSNASLDHILKLLHSRTLRDEVRKLASIFQLQRGPKPKIRRDEYGVLVARADALAPLIEKVLMNLDTKTKRSIREMLDYLTADHPDECAYLKRYVDYFEQALADTELLKRAHKRVRRARVLADALAGVEFKLRFRTSLDRVRSMRRSYSIGPFPAL